MFISSPLRQNNFFLNLIWTSIYSSLHSYPLHYAKTTVKIYIPKYTFYNNLQQQIRHISDISEIYPSLQWPICYRRRRISRLSNLKAYTKQPEGIPEAIYLPRLPLTLNNLKLPKLSWLPKSSRALWAPAALKASKHRAPAALKASKHRAPQALRALSSQLSELSPVSYLSFTSSELPQLPKLPSSELPELLKLSDLSSQSSQLFKLSKLQSLRDFRALRSQLSKLLSSPSHLSFPSSPDSQSLTSSQSFQASKITSSPSYLSFTSFSDIQNLRSFQSSPDFKSLNPYGYITVAFKRKERKLNKKIIPLQANTCSYETQPHASQPSDELVVHSSSNRHRIAPDSKYLIFQVP